MFEDVKDYLTNVELNEIFLSTFFRSVGLSMIGVFLPLFFLSRGLELSQVLIEFFGVMYLTSMLFIFPAIWLIERIGIKHTVIAALPLLIIELLMLYALDFFYIHHSLIAIFAGAAHIIYWIGTHTYFAMSADERQEGGEGGLMFLIQRLGKVAGPFTGGLIATFLGFPALFLTGLVIIGLAAVPLLYTEDVQRAAMTGITHYLSLEKVRYIYSFMLTGFKLVITGVIWPVFIFMALGSYVDVGAAGSLGILGTSILSGYFGHMSDATGTKNMMRIFAVPVAALYFAMPFARTALAIFTLSFLVGTLSMGIEVPVYRKYIQHTRDYDPIAYGVFREAMITFGRLIGISVAVVFIDYIAATFLGAGLMTLFLVV